MSRGSRGTRYGKEHERIRRREVAAYRPGQPCALGGEPLYGPPSRLDLAHNEAGTGYLGLACRVHNRGAAGALTDYHGRRKDADPEPRPWRGFD